MANKGALPEVFVLPGESRLVEEEVILRTVLGSCVGVAFWVPRLGIAGLCHPMLPVCPAETRARISPAFGRRYVDFAIRDFVGRLDSMGSKRKEVRVKLFGGADVLPVNKPSSRPTVGRLNAEAALRVLSEEGIEVVASRLGGTSGLQIRFHTGSGEVMVHRLEGGSERQRALSKPEGARRRVAGDRVRAGEP